SEANETALRLARAYHVDRGEPDRWQMVSPAQAYHGSTMATLALSGRPRSLQHPYEPYLSPHLHVHIGTDPEAALRELDARLEEAGPESVAAFFCEPISGAARPAYSPSASFWHGLAERREKHGFLVCFDEVVTGMGRTGSWFAYQQLPIEPDIVTVGKGLGAGYAPISAVLCKQHVYDAVDRGSRFFDLGHTWDGAPVSCATGLSVLDALESRGLVARVRERGPRLLEQLQAALRGNGLVREVRGRGVVIEVEPTPSTIRNRPTEHVEFVLLVIPDVNGSLRGKALRPDAFEDAVRHGTVVTDLLLALDPVDAPISDYERFGIRSGAADLVVHPDTSTLHDLRWRPGWRICLGTPSWPDGRRCELASREVLRGSLSQMSTLGYEVMAAVEYEVRLRDAEGRFVTSGVSYSATEIAALDR